MTETVRVRIAVAVDPTGNWSATGCNHWKKDEAMDYAIEGMNPGERHYWIEAELEVPEVQTIQGEVIEE